MCVYIYIYIYICVHMCVYIYIYIYLFIYLWVGREKRPGGPRLFVRSLARSFVRSLVLAEVSVYKRPPQWLSRPARLEALRRLPAAVAAEGGGQLSPQHLQRDEIQCVPRN